MLRVFLLMIILSLFLAGCQGEVEGTLPMNPAGSGDQSVDHSPPDQAEIPVAATNPAEPSDLLNSKPDSSIISKEPGQLEPQDSIPMPTQVSDPDKSPAPKDQKRGPVFLKQTDLLVRESYPPQIVLALKGSLPTPCHELHVDVAEADNQGRIQVEVYSTVDPQKICAQVLSPFEENVLLENLKDGKYTVWVNDRKVGEFSYP